MTLEVRDLASGYRQVPVVQDINFDIQPGEIIGLIGLNGAGKSTLLKTILGLIQPLEGQVLMNGSSLQSDASAYSRQLAYIPETPILYEELTLLEHLEMTALGYGIPRELVLERAQPLLEQFRLDKYLHWFPTQFSKGMKQKVMIICAWVTDAKLLIIDEPFLGLDPLAIRDLIHLMKDRADKGDAILFTTHVLSMADQLCDRYLFLQSGRIIAQGDLSQLREQFAVSEGSLDDLYLRMAEGK